VSDDVSSGPLIVPFSLHAASVNATTIAAIDRV
jgi:hypothetical protein